MYNGGLMGGYYLSVAGPSKNMRIADDPTPYFFEWVPGDYQYLRPYDETQFPGRLPEPVTLLPLTHLGDYQGVVLSCLYATIVVQFDPENVPFSLFANQIKSFQVIDPLIVS